MLHLKQKNENSGLSSILSISQWRQKCREIVIKSPIVRYMQLKLLLSHRLEKKTSHISWLPQVMLSGSDVFLAKETLGIASDKKNYLTKFQTLKNKLVKILYT